jgi:mxaJ protein
MMRRPLSASRGSAITVSLAAVVAVAACAANTPRRTAELRVCADPNNLPFSDSTGAGFENRLAALVADEMNARVSYTWWAQRRGFIRNTLNARECDVVMGVPTSFELALVTRPYYRSSYVFVSRRDRAIRVRSFDDSVLRNLRIGVQLVGDDYANAPPAHALARRGIVDNVQGFNVQGDYTKPSPPSRIIEAVTRGDVDLAVAWGPLAGYFASRQPIPLDLVPVTPQVDLPFLPFVFDISMGVRRGDTTFRDTLDAILVRRRASIDSLLDAYGVPLLGVRRRADVATAMGSTAQGAR